jgi:hypothetical protein
LRNDRPSTVAVGGHGTCSVGVRPVLSRASVLAALNVEPGGYCPVSARFAPLDGVPATARTSPVGTSMATSEAVPLPPRAVLRAASAAVWTAGSRLSASVCPGVGETSNSRRRASPCTRSTRIPDTPPSRSS